VKRAAMLVAALVAATPEPAHAGGSCGGGSSGGGSSGGGSSGGGSSGGSSGGGSSSSDSSSSSSSGSSSSTPACSDSSDVVGYRMCTQFGVWADTLRFPHIIIELGTSVKRFPNVLGTRSTSVTHGEESISYRVTMPTQRESYDVAVLSTLRLGVELGHGVYTGVDVNLGGIADAGHASTEMVSARALGTPVLEQQHGLVLEALGVAGMRSVLGPTRLSVELAGGVRSVSYTFNSHYLACEQLVTIGTSAPVLDARARGELWINPWLTVGATLGSSVIDRGAWSTGVFFGLHTRAFGGDR
jgi:hypothetical protein